MTAWRRPEVAVGWLRVDRHGVMDVFTPEESRRAVHGGGSCRCLLVVSRFYTSAAAARLGLVFSVVGVGSTLVMLEFSVQCGGCRFHAGDA